jgi:putative cell wall-binding protein
MKRIKMMLTAILLFLTVILAVLIVVPQKTNAVLVLGRAVVVDNLPICHCGAGNTCGCVIEEPQ